MPHWIDNADSYICSECGFETDNPNKQSCGAGKCSRCGANMDVKTKLVNILSVKDDEEWTIGINPESRIFRIHQGTREVWDPVHRAWMSANDEEELAVLIEHPEYIVRQRSLTDSELAICKIHNAKFVTRPGIQNNGPWLHLWSGKPTERNGEFFGNDAEGVKILARINVSEFLSIHPGDCINAEALYR